MRFMDTAAGRILIVEDHPSLLTLMTAYVGRLGYQVDSCNSAEKAWELFEAAPLSYALVLVDLNLPGMRGDELARRTLALSASIHVIAASGDPAELSGMDGAGRRLSFLHKPFGPGELASAITRSLDDVGRAGQGR
jgi:DNA-binding response OmpR family regulator